MLHHILWEEKYRPTTVKECILPERLKIPFLKFVEEKEIPNLILTGPAGVGKTTIARAMCTEIDCDFIEMSGSSKDNGVDAVRFKISNYASAMSLKGGRKVVIIDEADYLTPNAQAAFRTATQDFAKTCSFIFTCNYKNRIIEPMHSRCPPIEFRLRGNEKSEMAKLFFIRLQFILDSEKVEYDKNVLAELVKKYFPDYRRCINELQRYSKFGKIDVGILSQISDVKINELAGFLKNKNFGNVRKWVASNDVDMYTIYRQIYDSIYSIVKPESIPQAVLIIGDWQYKSSFASDQELNLVACLTDLMVTCQF